MTEHTELPWIYRSNGHYFEIGVEHKDSVMPVYPSACIGVGHEQEANAQLIVTAVNNHSRLVEALQEVTDLAVTLVKGEGQNPCYEDEIVSAVKLLTELGETK